MANALSISSQLTYAKAQGYLPAFDAAAGQTGIDRNLLLAVASRESGIGLSLDFNFLGDYGNGIGLMQIDRRYHKNYAALYDPHNNRQNVLEGARILQDEIGRYGHNLQYALDAYNAGSGGVDDAVNNGLGPDWPTTGRNYGSDVLQRYSIMQNLSGQPVIGSGSNMNSDTPLSATGKPENEAQKLVLISGGALLSSILVTSYIAAKKLRSRKSKVQSQKSQDLRPSTN